MQTDIIITCHNYGRFLGAAIESAFAQTHPGVRVIVVDDGSTDDSRDVISSYGDRITPVLKDNGGQASAFNAGFAASSGALVIFLDADDLLLPEAVARAAGALDTQPDAAKVQWAAELTDAAGVPAGTVMPAAHIPMPMGDMRAAELTYPFDLWAAATSANAFPAAVLRRLLPMPEEQFRVTADWYLQHLPPLIGPVVSLREVGTLRRVHGANAFEQTADAALDLGHIHEAIRGAEATTHEIERLAGELDLTRRPGPILSVAALANRIISLRLSPTTHPIAGDTRRRLATDGVRAAARRDDVHLVMRLAFAGWFAAMAMAPRSVALKLGRWFLFPEQRQGLNRILGRLHHSEQS